MTELPIVFADVAAARERLAGVAVRTPTLTNAELDARVGGRVLLKPETLQHAGSFKFRGAYNAVSKLDAAARSRGVVAFSSGNHAQGVALAAAKLGVKATIVMPKDAPAIKIAKTRGYGAEVVLYDRWNEDREAIGRRIAGETGASVIPPFNHPDVMAGQGTMAFEVVEDASRMGLALDAWLTGASGGGMIAGIATALGELSPSTAVYVVEPATHDDHRRSLAAGERLANDTGARSICDALMSPTPGKLTFEINRRRLAGGLAVTDEEVLDAMAFALNTLKLVVEPGGAVSLAALLSGKLEVAGRTVVVVLSGGNADPALIAEAAMRGGG